MTTTRSPAIPRPRARAAAQTKVASGPLASTAPRPWRTPPSIRTGISPGTVSMWPRRTTSRGPSPRTPTALPAPSIAVAKPRSSIAARRYSTAGRSRPERLGMATRPRSSSTSRAASAGRGTARVSGADIVRHPALGVAGVAGDGDHVVGDRGGDVDAVARLEGAEVRDRADLVDQQATAALEEVDLQHPAAERARGPARQFAELGRQR